MLRNIVKHATAFLMAAGFFWPLESELPGDPLISRR